MEKIIAKDIMTKNPITVRPETPLLEAAKIMLDHNFHGIPVVDDHNKLVGILTEYDLISKNSLLHLPTLQVLMKELDALSDWFSVFEKETANIRELKVKDLMNTDPITFPEGIFYDNIIEVFSEHHRVNPIPVVNDNKEVVGVISHLDVLKPLHKMTDIPRS